MKKVLFVMNTLGHAGAEAAMMELFRCLESEGYEISLYVLLGQGEMVKELPGHVRLLNRHFDARPVLGREGRAGLRRKVLRALAARGTVVRLFPYMARNFLAMCGNGGVLWDKLLWRAVSDGRERIRGHYDLAVAYLEGGSTYYVADHVAADRKAAFVHLNHQEEGYTRRLDRDCYLGYDRIFAVSEEVGRDFADIYPECRERTEVFCNVVDPERIRRMAQSGEGFRDGYEGFRILSVGRLTAQKAIEKSMEAMKLLKDSGERVRWYVLGDGGQRERLERMARRLGVGEDFLMPGAVDNPYPYMAQADIYVHASRFEGKSIAIQEARILGKPILVSDCSGNREQVAAGIDGLMCELTPEGICRGIRELMGDRALRLRLGRAAQERSAAEEADRRSRAVALFRNILYPPEDERNRYVNG